MGYSLRKAFEAYITLCEHYGDIDTYRKGAEVIRKGLPEIDKTQKGWRDIMEVKNFVEWVLTEEDQLVELAAEDDGASTISILTDESRKIMMTNPEDIKKEIFRS